jgi:PAS domain S-box-containing protein
MESTLLLEKMLKGSWHVDEIPSKSPFHKIKKKFRTLFFRPTTGLCYLTSDGRVVKADMKFLKFVGLKSDEVLNNHICQILSLGDMIWWDQHFNVFRKTDNLPVFTELYVGRSRTVVYAQFFHDNRQSANGQCHYVLRLQATQKGASKGYLKSEVENFKSILNFASDLIILCDYNTFEIQYVNKGWAEHSCLDGNVVEGQVLSETSLFKSNAGFRKLIDTVMDRGSLHEVEVGLRCMRNYPVYTKISIRPIYNHSQKQLLFVIRDITESKQTTDLLLFISRQRWDNTSEKPIDELLFFLYSLFEADFIEVATINTAVSKASTVSMIIGGEKQENISYDLLGTPCRNVADGNVCIYNQNVQELFPNDEWLVKLNGQSYIGLPLVDRKDRVMGLLAVVTSNSFSNPEMVGRLLQIAAQPIANEMERTRSEQRINAQEELFHQMAEKISDVIWVANADLKFRYISPSIRVLLGYSAVEAIGVPIDKLIDPVDLERLHKVADERFSNFKLGRSIDQHYFDEISVFHKTGKRIFVEVHMSLIVQNNVITGVIGSVHDITERKKTSDLLRQSEQRFRRLFEDNAAIMMLVDPLTGQIIDGNAAAEQFYGIGQTDLCALNFNELSFGPDDLTSPVLQVPLDSAKIIGRHEQVTANGIRKIVEIHASTIDVDDRYIMFLIIHDVTQSVEAEQARVNIEGEYKKLFDNLAAGFAVHEIIVDAKNVPLDYRFLAVNPYFETMLGLSRHEIVGRTVKEIFPDIEEKWVQMYGKVALTGQTLITEDYSQALGSYYSIIAYSAHPGQFAVIAQDVSDVKGKERDLAEREDQLNKIFENTRAGLILLNKRLEIVRMNAAGYELSSRNKLIDCNGKILGNVFNCINSYQSPLGCGHGSACDTCVIREMVTEALAERMSYGSVEVVFGQGNDGECLKRYFNISSSVVFIRGVMHVLLTIDDLTARKMMEIDLVDAKERAEQSDRLKSAFFNNLSHEIRTPLNGILGFANLLRKSDLSASDAQLYVSYINENSSRLLQIMNNVIELSQLNSGVLNMVERQMHLDELSSKIILQQKANCVRRNVNVISRYRGATKVFIDAKSLESIFSQVLDNAIKFSTDSNVEVRWYQGASSLSCLISDNGIGIATDDCVSIFTPFKQVEDGMTRNYGGVGLGLAIVTSHIKRCGGSIAVKSTVGKGSVFWFTLPLISKLY